MWRWRRHTCEIRRLATDAPGDAAADARQALREVGLKLRDRPRGAEGGERQGGCLEGGVGPRQALTRLEEWAEGPGVDPG